MNHARLLILLILTLSLGCRSTPRASAEPPLRIMPYGDSITRGKDGDGYRGSLAKLLARENIAFHFVGSLTDGPWWATEKAHEGHDGAMIHHLLANVDQRMREYEPDVVLLMIGANDLEARLNLDEMPSRYQTLLDRIVAARPRARVLVSEITLIRPREFDDLARAFNPKIRIMVEQMAARGKHITFVPMHDVVSLLELDAVDHPSFVGNQKIAERWMQYLKTTAPAAVAAKRTSPPGAAF